MKRHVIFIATIVRHNKLLASALLATIIVELFVYPRYATSDLFSWITLFRGIVLATLCAIILFPQLRRRTTTYDLLIKICTIFPLVFAIAVLYIFKIDPLAADRLAIEDGALEYLSALFCLVAAGLFFTICGNYTSKRHILPARIALFIGFIFFVIGMEEISWLQRILNIESNDFFMKYNAQQEINLHNLNIDLTAFVYYFGAFLLLILLPYYKTTLSRISSNKFLKTACNFIPDRWIIIPSSIMVGFIAYGNHIQTTIALALLLTIGILINEAARFYKDRDIFSVSVASIAVILLCILPIFFGTIIEYDFVNYTLRPWVAQEYMEFLIAFGIMIYAIDYFRSQWLIGWELPSTQARHQIIKNE